MRSSENDKCNEAAKIRDELASGGGNPAELTTTERRGRREVEQPKVGPKGESSGSERVKGHGEHGIENEVLQQVEAENDLLNRRTESKRSEERLPKAAQRVNAVNQFAGFTGGLWEWPC